jgi:hypothetical protein
MVPSHLTTEEFDLDTTELYTHVVSRSNSSVVKCDGTIGKTEGGIHRYSIYYLCNFK